MRRDVVRHQTPPGTREDLRTAGLTMRLRADLRRAVLPALLLPDWLRGQRCDAPVSRRGSWRPSYRPGARVLRSTYRGRRGSLGLKPTPHGWLHTRQHDVSNTVDSVVDKLSSATDGHRHYQAQCCSIGRRAYGMLPVHILWIKYEWQEPRLSARPA